jgi:hypothetical protein
MQFAFAYMYYMASVRDEFDLSKDFKELDTDGDGLILLVVPPFYSILKPLCSMFHLFL